MTIENILLAQIKYFSKAIIVIRYFPKQEEVMFNASTLCNRNNRMKIEGVKIRHQKNCKTKLNM